MPNAINYTRADNLKKTARICNISSQFDALSGKFYI